MSDEAMVTEHSEDRQGDEGQAGGKVITVLKGINCHSRLLKQTIGLQSYMRSQDPSNYSVPIYSVKHGSGVRQYSPGCFSMSLKSVQDVH